MPLKTVVKVSTITNLSDARYCAGMGVNMLGFNVVEGTTGYVSPAFFQELRGWFTGPKIVAEIYRLNAPDLLLAIIENYKPDFIELNLNDFQLLGKNITTPVILRLNNEELSPELPEGSFVITSADRKIKSYPPILIDTQNDQRNADLAVQQHAGIVLFGTWEEKTGQKTYDELAHILEHLTVD
ncbi:MAG: hypothetical protein L0Y35_07245 [Flammeovirgaceae bacterium]|nr:hypothetical protein [Flammeovirgaceae bacterium]